MSEQEIAMQIHDLHVKMDMILSLMQPTDEDPFELKKITKVAKDYGRNTQALTRKAEGKGWVKKVPGMGNANYIEARHIKQLLNIAS